jgi:hypothetical protein
VAILSSILLVNSHAKSDMLSATAIGTYKLPKINKAVAAAHCQKPTAICEVEARGEYNRAFTQYEKRFDTCGMSGWVEAGMLGHGHAGSVALRKTPCGLSVAMKGSRRINQARHTQYDCEVLELLTRYLEDPRCDGCFPRYYYFSNLTNICYSEHVPSVPISVYFDHVNANVSAGFQHLQKAFVEGLNALEILQAAGVQHRDLSFRNIVIRQRLQRAGTHVNDRGVVFLDFGGSNARPLGRPLKVDPNLLGNFGASDAYTYACDYFRYFYPLAGDCRHDHGIPKAVRESPTSTAFQKFLAAMMENHVTWGEVDYEDLRTKFASVKSL